MPEKVYPETAGNAGLVMTRRSRATGTLVSIYRAEEAGIDAGEQPLTQVKYPAAVVCETHGTILGVATIAAGRMVLPTPHGFCEECRWLRRGASSTLDGRVAEVPSR